MVDFKALGIDLTNLGDDVDPEAVLALAGVLLSIAVPAAGPVVSTIQQAFPVALRLYKMVKSDHFSQEELAALNAVINANTAKIEAPLSEP